MLPLYYRAVSNTNILYPINYIYNVIYMSVISLHTQTKLLLFYDINPLSLLLYSTIENNKKKNRGH